MIDDPLSLLSLGIWLMAAGMYPVGFLFGACSPCCKQCPWLIEFDRCMRVSVVGSDPPVGGDCRIIAFRQTSGGQDYMSSDVLQIHNVQSQIRVSIRTSLSATEASRTPVGETRTQVWRFNRGTPFSPVSSTYDVLGPPWHLQVDLSVTGVATQAEAGVVSSIEQDSEGQPKLVLTVRQWTEAITHDEIVTLFPTGLQRWGAGAGAGVTENFRLTEGPSIATRVSGDNISGWAVSKLQGLTIDERQLAVRLTNTLLCEAGTSAEIVERIILNDTTANAFLNGDEELVVSTLPSFLGSHIPGDRSLRIMPNNALCGLASGQTDVGVALGIYPEVVYATPSQFFIDDATARGAVYCDTGGLAMRLASTPPFLVTGGGTWKSTWSHRGIGRSEFGWITVQVHNFFYSGKSLLWNAEHGPYRTTGPGRGPATYLASGPHDLGSSFSDVFPGWTVHLEGDGDEFYNKPDEGMCPDGMVLGGGLTHENAHRPGFGASNFFNVCTPASIEVQGTYEWTYTNCLGQEKSFSGSLQGTLTRAPDEFSRFNFFLYRGVIFSGSVTGEQHQDVDCAGLPIPVRLTSELLFAEIPCALAGNLTFTGVEFFVFNGSLSVEITSSIPFASRSRPSCSEWTIAPAEGGTITRTCENLEGYSPAGAGTPVVSGLESIVVPPRNSRFSTNVGYEIGSPNKIPGFTGGARGFYGPGPTQLGACVLYGVSSLSDPSRALLPNPTNIAPLVGNCIRYLPVFGSNFPSPNDGNLSRITAIPCDGCTPTVEIVSGEGNASVRYISEGDMAGVIELIAKTTWAKGQGVTFAVSCGSDTITQVVRRPTTAPTAPRNLTVVRGPCSEAALSWQAPVDEGGEPITEYTIQFRRIGDALYTTFGTVSPPTLSAVVTGLLRVGYQFRVSATNSVGTSAFSNIATSGFELSPPSALAFTRGLPCTSLQLSWTKPATAECVVLASYIVQFRVVGASAFTTAATLDEDATNYTIEGLAAGTRYQFRVGVLDEANVERFSGTLTSGNLPVVPTGVTLGLGSNLGEVDVAWNATDEPCFENTDYLVQFRPNTTSTWTNFLRPASVDKFATVTGLMGGVTYFFRVRATNSVGNSGFSAQSAAITIPEPE